MSLSALSQDTDKYKSLLIYKISEYIVWPDNPDNIKIGTVGESNVGAVLASFAERRDHMTVSSVHHANQIGNCNMIYLPESQASQLKYYRMKISANSVLVVSENKDDIKRGADIVIYTENGKLKYIVNESTITGKGMIPSKKLSSLGSSI